MKNQDILRQQVKLAKAISDWNYKDMSQVIQLSTNSFYNWLVGKYQLSSKKMNELESLIDDLMA